MIQRRIPLEASLVLGSYFSRLILERKSRPWRVGDIIRRSNCLGVYEIEADPTLAESIRFLAVLTSWDSFIALKVPFPAREAACANSFGLRCFIGNNLFLWLQVVIRVAW